MKRLFVGCLVRYVNRGHPMHGTEGKITWPQNWHENCRCMRTGVVGRHFGYVVDLRGLGDFIAAAERLEPAVPDGSRIRETERELEPA